MRHKGKRFQTFQRTKRYRVNRGIRSPQLRVVGDDGEPLGIIPLDQALALAREKDLDLVEVSPQSNPPVAKLMDYGKFKYSMEKKNREARKKSKASSLKEVKLRIKIGDHDFNFKKNHAVEFFKGGHKVKVTLTFFGREMTHRDLGEAVLNRMIQELQEFAKIEMPAKFEGRSLSAIMIPKPGIVVHKATPTPTQTPTPATDARPDGRPEPPQADYPLEEDEGHEDEESAASE